MAQCPRRLKQQCTCLCCALQSRAASRGAQVGPSIVWWAEAERSVAPAAAAAAAAAAICLDRRCRLACASPGDASRGAGLPGSCGRLGRLTAGRGCSQLRPGARQHDYRSHGNNRSLRVALQCGGAARKWRRVSADAAGARRSGPGKHVDPAVPSISKWFVANYSSCSVVMH